MGRISKSRTIVLSAMTKDRIRWHSFAAVLILLAMVALLGCGHTSGDGARHGIELTGGSDVLGSWKCRFRLPDRRHVRLRIPMVVHSTLDEPKLRVKVMVDKAERTLLSRLVDIEYRVGESFELLTPKFRLPSMVPGLRTSLTYKMSGREHETVRICRVQNGSR